MRGEASPGGPRPARSRPKRALVPLLPLIDAAIEAGIAHETIIELLGRHGIDVQLLTFRSIFYRWRRELRRGGRENDPREADAIQSPLALELKELRGTALPPPRRPAAEEADAGAEAIPAPPGLTPPGQSQSERLAAALDPAKRAERASTYLEMKPPIFGAKPKVQE